MGSKNIKISIIQANDNGFNIFGSIGSDDPVTFAASTFQWGSKMLIKVHEGDLDRGTRIAVGHAAKRALKAANLELPTATLKRPRKPKAEPVQEAPKEDFSGKSVKELRQLCKDRGIKGHSRDGITKADLINLLGG